MGKQRITTPLLNLRFGIHHLAAAGVLQAGDRRKLQKAVEIGAAAGATLIEVVGPISNLSVADTAGAIIDGGMKDAAWCVFFPTDGMQGDPLAVDGKFQIALDTFRGHLDKMVALRQKGININVMTGPNGYRLGYDYCLPEVVLNDRLNHWYGHVDAMARDAGVMVTVEFLRREEDFVLKGTPALKKLIRRQGSPRIRAHFDVFHALRNGENPAESVELLGADLGWLHGHGEERLAPGAVGDGNDWGLMHAALEKAGYTGAKGGVLVVEPFGPEIRADIPVLGEGLPPAEDPATYMAQAGNFLRNEGFIPKLPA